MAVTKLIEEKKLVIKYRYDALIDEEEDAILLAMNYR